MSDSQFHLGQKVIYKKMEKNPLTLLTVTEIKGSNITVQLPGGSLFTSDKSSFQKYVPPKDNRSPDSDLPKKKYTNKKYNKTNRSFKKK